MPSRLIPSLFVLLWATGFIGARYAMPWSEPFTFLGVRFGITFVILAAIILFARRAWPNPRAALRSAVAGILMHGVYLGGVFWAVRNGMPAGMSALIVGLQPLITAVMAGAALGERILPRHWAGLAAGFVGVAIVLSPKLGDVADALSFPTLAAAVIAVVAMSAGTVWQKRFSANGDIIAGTMIQYLAAALVMTVLSFVFETRTVVLTGELVLAMVWSVLVLSIGAIFLLMRLIRDGDMAKVGSLFYLVPPVTALMAWPLFGETLSWLQIAGMAIAVIGVGLATAQSSASSTRLRASR
jgi:drug/metabolite transporter (DMT)-like permease